MVSSAKGKLKVLKIVLWSILGAVLLFVFIVVGTLLVQKYINKSKAPMFAGYGYYIVVTRSMSGTIEKGDMIIVKKSDEYVVQQDIITYVSSSGEVITHRLVNYLPDEDKYIAKGDANTDTDDEHISFDQIVGKVVFTIPKVGLFFEWVLHDGGIIYIISILAVVVAGLFFLNMIKSDNGEKASAATAEENSDGSAAPPETNADIPADTPETAVQSNDDNLQNNS